MMPQCRMLVFLLVLLLPSLAEAACVRVYQSPAGPVRVVIPNRKNLAPPETETAFCLRTFATAQARLPSLRGLPYADMDDRDLPARTERDAQGDERAIRNAWRLVQGRIVVDRTAIGPSWERLSSRLRAVLPAADRRRLAGWLADLDRAVIAQDAAQVRGHLDALEANQGDPRFRLDAMTLDAVRATFTAKGF